jgi:hypothetical protein
MSKPLLDRQIELLAYLTSNTAIFGDHRGTPLPGSLRGLDRRRLDLEARFSHQKRMEKIFAVFPETLRLLGADGEAVVRGFTDSCPPLDISRVENARQFHDFLVSMWQQTPPVQPYMPDVAAFELACARAKVQQSLTPVITPSLRAGAIRAIRRNGSIILLRTRFDIRGLFWDQPGQAINGVLPERPACLAVFSKSGAPAILELAPEIFDLLGALDEWTALDELPGASELATELAEAALLECRL